MCSHRFRKPTDGDTFFMESDLNPSCTKNWRRCDLLRLRLAKLLAICITSPSSEQSVGFLNMWELFYEA